MSRDCEKLKNIPAKGGVIFAGDSRIESYSEDTMMRGAPDAVLVARDEEEVRDALAFCNGHEIQVTFCGSQTSMTGASVAEGGLLISTEKLEGTTDISTENGELVATVRSGTIVADFQRAVADAGYFYPVAPTSRDECRIGSNVATNATGEDSYKYGPVRAYLKRVELILPTGDTKTLERDSSEKPSWERNRAGYFEGWKNPIDLICGSEGTLGFVSKASFRLLPRAKDFFSALVPMPSNEDALKMVMGIASGSFDIRPRALELIDGNALAVMQTANGFPALVCGTEAVLYMKLEFDGEAERERMLSMLYDLSLSSSGQGLADGILVAQTHAEQEDFRLWRHHIPESENENGRMYWAAGGGKIGSDWWVPIPKLPEMMSFFYEAARASKLPHIAYAHIGAGHPHTNFLARDAAEKCCALDTLRLCCSKAVSLGGGVAGEHGIGKIHTDLVSIQHAADVIERMKEWKRQYDPKWILGRGNIFPSS